VVTCMSEDVCGEITGYERQPTNPDRAKQTHRIVVLKISVIQPKHIYNILGTVTTCRLDSETTSSPPFMERHGEQAKATRCCIPYSTSPTRLLRPAEIEYNNSYGMDGWSISFDATKASCMNNVVVYESCTVRSIRLLKSQPSTDPSADRPR